MKLLKPLILLIFAISISCNKKDDGNNYHNFEYTTLTDNYNSQTNIFTRKYGYEENDSVNIKIILSAEEKKSILDSFLENEFFGLSKEIDCSSWMVQPRKYNHISLWNKVNRHSVTYISSPENFMLFCPSGIRFLKIEEKIQEILYSKTEIKSLPVSNIAYE